MKKVCVFLLVVMLLTGCGQQNYEVRQAPCGSEAETSVPGVISICKADELAAPVMSTYDGDCLYIADTYEVYLQTLPGGDLNETMKQCTGFDREKLTVLQTQKDGLTRYDCVWSSAGEGTQCIGRTTILDDGSYHYVLTITGQNGEEVADVWQQLSESFTVNIVQ